MSNETIGVLMSVYDGEKPSHLNEALNSILCQEKKPDEIILIIDGPINRNLEKIITQYEIILNLSLKRLKKNTGLANALNIGVNIAKSEWLARFDSDDIMAPNRIALCLEKIKKNNLDFFGFQIEEFDSDDGSSLGNRVVPLTKKEITKAIEYKSPFNHVTMCLKKSVLNLHPYPNINGFEDYALWGTLISQNFNYMNFEEVVVKVRAGDAMLSRRTSFSYLLGEIKIRKHLLTFKKFNKIKILAWGLIRITFFMSPTFIKSIVYKRLLRLNKV